MAGNQVSNQQFIEALLRERDELYRRAVKAERRCEELSDVNAMKQQYEARIKKLEAYVISSILSRSFCSINVLS